ncbi:MAG: hypothetical protein IID44_01200 [Planctomycetes bacterium]|nr:hypothetical protein [Planctomycetota bacterium]
MSKLVLFGFILVALLAVLLGSGYFATQQVDALYREALDVDAATQALRSDEMLQRATTLRNDLQKEGAWEALFTDEQMNGWLADDMVRNHPDLLPAEVTDPRVTISPEAITLYFRYQGESFSTVLSVSFDVYLAEENVIGLRLDSARAGALPVPMSQVIEYIQEAAVAMELKIEWKQSDGDPVALITIPPQRDDGNQLLRIEQLRLDEGKIYIAGRIDPTAANRSAGESGHVQPYPLDQSAARVNNQRRSPSLARTSVTRPVSRLPAKSMTHSSSD